MLSNNKTNFELWAQYRGKIISHNGGWFVEKGAFSYGHNIMQELVGEISYMQLIVLNVTGKIPSKNFADWLEAFFMGLSWPDSRLWCNQIGALGASLRSNQMAAILAGALASDSRIYGVQPLVEAIAFIKKVEKASQSKLIADIIENLPKSKGKPLAMGYARPIAVGDERVSVMVKIAKKLNFEKGLHVKLCFRIEAYLEQHYQEKINIAGYASAFFVDQGYSAKEIYAISTTLVSSGVTACYLDYLKKPAETFLPLECNDVIYQGKEKRTI